MWRRGLGGALIMGGSNGEPIRWNRGTEVDVWEDGREAGLV